MSYYYINVPVRTVWNILKRLILGLLLAVYVLVALLNTSVLQSYLGKYVGNYFSREWGGTVKIGSLHATPFNHIIIDNLLLINPDGDTIADAEHISVRFRKFPFNGDGLSVDRLYVRNTYYHLVCHDGFTNLQYIIDYFNPNPDTTITTPESHFVVKVGNVRLSNVHYKMDLDEVPGYVTPDSGVVIPHMEFYNIRGVIRNVRVDNDYVDCRVVHLETTEKSGFRMNDMTALVKVSPYIISAQGLDVSTNQSRIICDAKLTYDTWEAMDGDGYCFNVQQEAILHEGTSVSMSDVAYWAPVLWGMTGRFDVEGRFYGPVNNMFADNAHIVFGNGSIIELDGHVTGLPYPDSLGLDVHLERLLTNYNDIQGLGFGKTTLKINMPEILAKLGDIEASANVVGTMKRCSAVLTGRTALGDIDASASLTYNDRNKKYSYSANIASEGFGIAAVVPNEWVARTGIDIAVNGEGFNPDEMTATVDGRLYNTMLKGKKIAVTSINADIADRVLTADIALNDTLAKINISGNADWSDSLMAYSVDVAVDNAHLTELGLTKADSLVVSTQLRADATGNDIEHINASVEIENTLIEQPGKSLNLNNAVLRVSEKSGRKSVGLTSDIIRASIDGYFDYSNLALNIRSLIDRYVPRNYNQYYGSDIPDYTPIASDILNFSIVFDDEQRQLQPFLPNIGVAPGTTITGNYNYAEALKLVLRSDSVRLGPVTFGGVVGNGRAVGGSYRLVVGADELLVGVRPVLENIDITAFSDTSTISASIAWDDSPANVYNEGNLSFRLADETVDVIDNTFYVNGARWDVACPDGISLADGNIDVDKLTVSSDGHGIEATASIKKQYNDFVELQFDNLALKRLSNVLLQNSPIDAAGDLNGRFSLFGISSKPYFNAKLSIDSCVINTYPLGIVDIQSSWNSELNQLNLYLTADPLTADGYMALGPEHPELDFAVDFNSLNLSIVEPLLTNVASNFGGILHGGLRVEGTLEEPDISGAAIVENGIIKLDMTGVTYTFNDSIVFDSNTIILNDFKIIDPAGNTATIDGNIVYNGLDSIDLGINLHADNITILDNRPRGDSFYGTILVALGGKIYGTLNDINIDVDARTNPGSILNVPVNDRRQIQSQNYITFVSDTPEPKTKTNKKQSNEQASTGINLQVNLEITPDVTLNLPMDFSEATARISTSGQGDVLFTLDASGSPNVLGSYTFSSGTMKLGLLSLFEKNFTIENGSSLNFQGDVMNTMFDISAIYSQRVNMTSLTGVSVESSQKTILVEDVINIAGTLQNPEINFDIRLPNADQSVQEEVFSYIDKSNERDMLNQAMSLLLFGQFANTSTSAATSVSENSGVDGISVVANSLSSVLSDMVQFVDVNVDYKGATSLTTEQVEVDISKEWKNVYFTSTFGYGGEARELSEAEGGTLVGDLLVGLKVTPALHLFMYNRSNTNDYTRIDMPFKQGVGLKLTKDFDRWGDLFKIKKR